MNKIILFLSIFSISQSLYAIDCGKFSTQHEMTNCIIQKLNKTEKKLDNKIKKISEIFEEKTEFERSNKVWLEYRDAHCLSVSKIYEGGSIYNFALTECKINQTNLRINTLENDYKATINIITKGSP